MIHRSTSVMFVLALLSVLIVGVVPAYAEGTTSDAPAAVLQGCTVRTDWPTYTVQAGDTLYNISRRAGTTVDVLKAGNCLTSNLIVVGTTLYVPTAIDGSGSGPMIDIQQPTAGSALIPGESFTVSGQARALFEGSLVVQVQDSSGDVLVQNAVTAGGNVAIGGTGSWSTSFSVNVPDGTAGSIYAYATSARDGSTVAEDQVSVTFGGVNASPMIDIQQPTAGSTLTPGVPFTVSGQARALFEAGLVVQVRDSAANVLAENAITAGGNVATGGTGPWSTSFTVSVPSGTTSAIFAYATSPRDGSIVAQDQINVTFGSGDSDGTGCTVRTDWPVYRVQPGDNLFRIGLQYNATVTTLAAANCLANPGLIYVGQPLHVPAF